MAYLKDTPTLDKKVMGHYLISRKNLTIFDELVKSFDFSNVRIDESLQLFFETFRLPFEAWLISNVILRVTGGSPTATLALAYATQRGPAVSQCEETEHAQ
jgi:hypothetical protein